jgi:magnesium transporter
MIEIYYKNNNVKKYKSVDEIDYLSDSIFSVRFIGFNNSDLESISQKFKLDLSSSVKKEDIEISSHYTLQPNFTIPHYSLNNTFEENDIYIVIKNDIVFTFLI